MRVLTTLQRSLARGLLYLAALALLLLTLLITVNVLGRWLLGSGVRGSEELSIYLMIATVYLGLAGTLADGRFISVELLTNRLRRRAGIFAYAVAVTLSLAFCLLLARYAWYEALNSLERGILSIGELRVPLGWPQLLVAIGTSVLCLQLLVILASLAVHPARVTAKASSAADSIPQVD